MKFKDHTLTEPTGEFAATIRDFRAAVTHIAGRETARPVVADWLTPARKRRRGHQHRMILAWGCAAALCFATVPFFLMPASSHHGPTYIDIMRQTPTPTPTAHSSEPGNSLLEQVDEQVSEPVPTSLAPLAEMENWGRTSTKPSSASSDSSLGGMALALSEGTNAAR